MSAYSKLRLSSPLQVLLVVDSLYWVVGNFSRQLQQGNPYLRALVCSKFTIRHFLKFFGHFPLPFDLVHFLTPDPLPSFQGQLPIVTTLHHRGNKTNLQPFQDSDATMTVSLQWFRHLKHLGIPEHKLGLIPFGVDCQAFHRVSQEGKDHIRKELRIPLDATVIGFSGKSSSDREGRKGLECYLQGMQAAARKIPNLWALLIGGGWEHLEAQLQQKGIPTRRLPFQIEHKNIARFYQVTDIFWVTSNVEGGPVTLLEAMACGVPCISTPVGGALDVIQDRQNGFLVPFNHFPLFAELSYQLSKDQRRRRQIGEQACKTIQQTRQWNQAREQIFHLYVMARKHFHEKLNKDTTKAMIRNIELIQPQKDTPSHFIPLDLDSPNIQRWMEACEYINGIRTMMKMREWKVAKTLAVKTIKTVPTDPYLLKQLVKAFRVSQKFTNQT